MRMLRRAGHGGRTASSIPPPTLGRFVAKRSNPDIFGGVVPIPWATLSPGAMGTPRAAQGVQPQPPASPTSHASNPGLGLLSNHATRLWAPHSDAGSGQPPKHAVPPEPGGDGCPWAGCLQGWPRHQGFCCSNLPIAVSWRHRCPCHHRSGQHLCPVVITVPVPVTVTDPTAVTGPAASSSLFPSPPPPQSPSPPLSPSPSLSPSQYCCPFHHSCPLSLHHSHPCSHPNLSTIIICLHHHPCSIIAPLTLCPHPYPCPHSHPCSYHHLCSHSQHSLSLSPSSLIILVRPPPIPVPFSIPVPLVVPPPYLHIHPLPHPLSPSLLPFTITAPVLSLSICPCPHLRISIPH